MIDNWEGNISNAHVGNVYNPLDLRISIPKKEYKPIASKTYSRKLYDIIAKQRQLMDKPSPQMKGRPRKDRESTAIVAKQVMLSL